METEEIAEEAEKIEKEREQRDQERRDFYITKELWKVYSNKVLRFFATWGIILFIVISIGTSNIFLAFIPLSASLLAGALVTGKIKRGSLKSYSKTDYYNKLLRFYTIWNLIPFLITMFGLLPVWAGLSVYIALIPWATILVVCQIVLKKHK